MDKPNYFLIMDYMLYMGYDDVIIQHKNKYYNIQIDFENDNDDSVYLKSVAIVDKEIGDLDITKHYKEFVRTYIE